MSRVVTLTGILALTAMLVGCGTSGQSRKELKRLALDSAAEVVAQHLCEFDEAVSSDGNGSIRITAEDSMVVRIADVTGIDVEDALLFYQAKLKAENLQGNAYLEMWCQFPEKGEYFSRDLATPVTGTTPEWSIEETPFLLKRGQRPQSVKLNLVVTGPGTVWIDDISLQQAPTH